VELEEVGVREDGTSNFIQFHGTTMENVNSGWTRTDPYAIRLQLKNKGTSNAHYTVNMY